MRNKWISSVAGVALGAVLLAGRPAVAAALTATYTINANGFADVVGMTTAPTDPVRLSVLISFDPAAGDQFDYGLGIALRSSSVAVSGPIAFDYDSADDILTVGGAGLSTSITAGTNDILAEIIGIKTGLPSFGGLEYATAASSGIYLSTTGGITVPEPGSMLVLLGGLLGLASIRRRV